MGGWVAGRFNHARDDLQNGMEPPPIGFLEHIQNAEFHRGDVCVFFLIKFFYLLNADRLMIFLPNSMPQK